MEEVNKCFFCGKGLEYLPYTCRYCGESYCSEHRLPENHYCKGLKKWKRGELKEFKKKIPVKKTEQPFLESYGWTPRIKPRSRIKFNIVWIILILFVIFLVILKFSNNNYSLIDSIISPATCTDGTLYNLCSENKPYYCSNGNLIENASNCGCPYDYKIKGDTCQKIQRCSDGTIYGECSSNKPKFCVDGGFINRATVCGCPTDEVPEGEGCISKYLINPKTITLSYIINGKKDSLNLEVYGGMNDYLASIDREISYAQGGPEPTFKDFVIKNIDNQKQREFLLPLAEKIKTLSNDSDNQSRIAISLVQNIPYDYGNLKDRYAYQVLFDNNGVCGEKSRLLVTLLRELGYGTALIDYGNIESRSIPVFSLDISHEAVGIRCPLKYSYKNTGYCFIETTNPEIITYSNGDYPSLICQVQIGTSTSSCTQKLPDNFTLTVISDGKSFDSVENEYNDAKELDRLITLSESSGGVLSQYNYDEWLSLAIKYGIKFSSG
jgi:hypothetical protein